MPLLLKNARLLDPAGRTDRRGDLAIVGERLVDPAELPADAEVLDLAGKAVVPGLIDVHVHLREPGQTHKETIASGSRAAAAGGFTTIVAMPNTAPPIDSLAALEQLQRQIDATAVVTVLPTACLTAGRAGAMLSPIAELAASGHVVAFTDDGSCVANEELMRRALAAAARAGLPVMDHCEDVVAKGDGVMRAGPVAERLGVPGMPPETESNIVARNLRLAASTGARIHLQHLSCRRSVELLREARDRGLPVTGEATPHHLCLTADLLPLALANAKMNPPLGTEDDRQALLEAVIDGAIGIVATDHAPHSPAEKAAGLIAAPFGIIGLETALPLLLAELGDRMPLLDLFARLTTGPAALLGLPTPSLAPGAIADLAILDLDAAVRIDLGRGQSHSCNAPWHGWSARGRIIATFARGRPVYGPSA